MPSIFAHKQPTRFNEPEIPQDLATKGYVDGRAGDAIQYTSLGFDNNPQNNEFFAMNNFGGVAAEDRRQNLFPFAVGGTMQKHFISIVFNTQVLTSSWQFRINGADANAVISIGAGLLGIFSQETDDSLVEEDVINYQIIMDNAFSIDMRVYSCRGVLN